MNKHLKYKLSPGANVFFVILAISSITYTLFNRSLFDFLKYSFYIDIALLAFSSILLFLAFRKFKSIDVLVEKNRLTSFVFLLCFLGPIYYSIGVVLGDIPKFRQIIGLPKNLIIPVGVFAILLIGLILFYFRYYYRCLYGITETAIGLIIAVDKFVPNQIEEFTKSGFYLAVLTASVYLVVRGFDNIHHGLTKEPFDPMALKIKQIFNRMES